MKPKTAPFPLIDPKDVAAMLVADYGRGLESIDIQKSNVDIEKSTSTLYVLSDEEMAEGNLTEELR